MGFVFGRFRVSQRLLATLINVSGELGVKNYCARNNSG